MRRRADRILGIQRTWWAGGCQHRIRPMRCWPDSRPRKMGNPRDESPGSQVVKVSCLQRIHVEIDPQRFQSRTFLDEHPHTRIPEPMSTLRHGRIDGTHNNRMRRTRQRTNMDTRERTLEEKINNRNPIKLRRSTRMRPHKIPKAERKTRQRPKPSLQNHRLRIHVPNMENPL